MIEEECKHPIESYNKENFSCLECGLVIYDKIESNEITNSYFFDGEEQFFSSKHLLTKKSSCIGLKKFENKEKFIKKIEQLSLNTDEDMKKDKKLFFSSTKIKNNSNLVNINENYCLKNIKGGEFKPSFFNFKDSSFENFLTIYTNIFINNNIVHYIIGNKFYTINQKKTKYAKPCFCFINTNLNNSFKMTLTDCLNKLKNKEFLFEVYLKYKQFYKDKKRNKLKTVIECFEVCLFLHYFLIHKLLSETPSTLENIIKKCIGTQIKQNQEDKLSYKKKKMRSHIYALTDIFNLNEVTTQTHINNFINFIKIS